MNNLETVKTIILVFGATGDLAKRNSAYPDGRMPEKFRSLR
jgi:hypothetical protein